MAINTFTYNGSRSSNLGLYISKRTVKYPAHRTTEKPQDARDGSWMIPSLTFPAQEVVYECFITDNVHTNISLLMEYFYKQEIPAKYRQYAKVDDFIGYKILRDTYDTDGYRLACVTAAPSVEILRNYAAAQVKITFTCVPGVFLDAGATPIDLPADTTTEIPIAPIEAREYDSFPVIRTTGNGTIWMRDSAYYPMSYGEIITIDDMAYFDDYTLVQDCRIGRKYLYRSYGDQMTGTDFKSHVHWNEATKNGLAADRIRVPKIWAGSSKYNVTTSGTVSGTIIPNWWRM